MRQKAARFGVTLAMAATLAVGALAAAPPASAKALGWTPYQGYKTLTACAKAGAAHLSWGWKEYECRWDSPYYMLWLRS
ncbi:hypothetical protein ACI2LC_42700 [Nonomuraea wenchangensis]|uniref:hypothetical protein n=1 Tax=Nonomuraea wenchangensis TaxID=568860 RepID=UPI0033CE8434